MVGREEDPFDKLRPRRGHGCPPSLQLEVFAFASPRERERAPLRVHLLSCSQCRSGVEQLERERAAFLEDGPPAAFMTEVVARAEREPAPVVPGRGRPASRRTLRWTAAALVAAALALAVITRSELSATRDPEGIRLRGTAALELGLFVSRAGGPALPLAPEERLAEGDVLRFAARSARPGYASIVNVDDRGHVTQYLPQRPGASLRIEASERLTPLPQSIRLDGFVGRELIALVISDEPLATDMVVSAFTRAYAASGGRLDHFAQPELEARVHWRIIHKRAP
jgi:hypothetical protein